MLLSELTTPFKRLPVYVYDSDHTTAVKRVRELQHISGTAYKDRNKADQYGNVHCNIYAYYPELGIGMWIAGLGSPDYRSAEAIEKSFCEQGLETPEQFIAELERSLAEVRHIGNVQVAFARIAAPERADAFAEGRLAYRHRVDEEAAARRAKQEAEDAAFCAERNAEFNDAVDAATMIIRNGGVLENKAITQYRSRYDSSTCRIINHLARLYQVQIPLKVQGWINHHLISIKIDDDGIGAYTYRKGHRSETFSRYMLSLIRAVRSEAAVDTSALEAASA